jgi:hypothetical protein
MTTRGIRNGEDKELTEIETTRERREMKTNIEVRRPFKCVR